MNEKRLNDIEQGFFTPLAKELAREIRQLQASLAQSDKENEALRERVKFAEEGYEKLNAEQGDWRQDNAGLERENKALKAQVDLSKFSEEERRLLAWHPHSAVGSLRQIKLEAENRELKARLEKTAADALSIDGQAQELQARLTKAESERDSYLNGWKKEQDLRRTIQDERNALDCQLADSIEPILERAENAEQERDDWKLRYETREDGLLEKLAAVRARLTKAEEWLRFTHEQIQEAQTILAGHGDSDPRDWDATYLRTGIRQAREITSKLVDSLDAFLSPTAPETPFPSAADRMLLGDVPHLSTGVVRTVGASHEDRNDRLAKHADGPWGDETLKFSPEVKDIDGDFIRYETTPRCQTCGDLKQVKDYVGYNSAKPCPDCTSRCKTCNDDPNGVYHFAENNVTGRVGGDWWGPCPDCTKAEVKP